MAAKAQISKDQGNAAFKAGKYADAVGFYTAAIFADRKDPTFPLNRAAAYLKLGKNEDAERDCSTVLDLSAGNVKALFRRAQAKAGLGKNSEALADLKEALRLEPANDAVKQELKRVSEIVEKQKQPAKKVPAPTSSAAEPKAAPASTVTATKRRRIPIKVVEPPTASTSQPAKPSKSVETKGTSPQNDLMTPVSSRSIKSTAPASFVPPTKASSSDTSTPPPVPSTERPVLNPVPPAPKPNDFKEAKQVRESTKTSRVGGGIFRASGKNTIIGERDSPSPAPSGSSAASPTPTSTPPKDVETKTPPNPSTRMPSSPPPPQSPAPPITVVPPTPRAEQLPPQKVAPPKPPTTLFNFTRVWDASPSSERWPLLRDVPAASLPALFQMSLEPALLASILRTLADALDGGADAGEVREYVESFTRVPRFGTVALFMSTQERAAARDVWARLGAEGAGPAWSAVLR